ncbi:hypothetical protein ACFCX4_08990 [Kitasatospora sp. NPDC056327]|uniref:hypothetical protein n=1 Tax=Kitasatospora sp. NPDC056327 TaxID=3345785 RepID=UPI0035DAE157
MTAREEGRARGTLVEALSSALERGGSGLENAPELLRRLLTDGSWRSFVTVRGELVEYERFADFVVTPPLKGLGVTVALVRRVVADSPTAVDLLDRTLQRPSSVHAHDNVQGAEAPTGNTQAAALRRLRKDAPELHAEVLAGHLSAHAAMVRAGFRRRAVSVPVDDTEATARALRKHLPPEALADLAALLTAPVVDYPT